MKINIEFWDKYDKDKNDMSINNQTIQQKNDMI